MPLTVRLFLCGDVMTGRGIDQILPYPCDPTLHEAYVRSANDYVRLAERAHGPIPRHVSPSYIWGDALAELDSRRPDVRIINLETSVTRCGDAAQKGINYKMSAENAGCLRAAAIDCCVLANNHVLDWGTAGLTDTLAALAQLGIKTAGAGRTPKEACFPAVLEVRTQARVLVFAFASEASGTPASWAATSQRPGVNLLDDLSEATACRVGEMIGRFKRTGDVVVASVHWGPNWGYEIPLAHRKFAHTLIERAGVSVIHGHSSHHAKAIEVHNGSLILYGCGDFLNDYEGISGYEAYRSDLALMYFVDVNVADGTLAAVEIIPLQIRNFRLIRASPADVAWLQETLDHQSRQFAVRIQPTPEGTLALAPVAPTTAH
jgi:poly-gamma-glutamate capsule biosynthesis protein CapA/YwtB (metallophosphatase superfamily)